MTYVVSVTITSYFRSSFCVNMSFMSRSHKWLPNSVTEYFLRTDIYDETIFGETNLSKPYENLVVFILITLKTMNLKRPALLTCLCLFEVANCRFLAKFLFRELRTYTKTGSIYETDTVCPSGLFTFRAFVGLWNMTSKS